MAWNVEGTLKEFSKRRNPYAPKSSESPFGDFPADFGRPEGKGGSTRRLGASGGRSQSPTLAASTPAHASSSPAVPESGAVTKYSGVGGATSSLHRVRRQGLEGGTSGRDGTFGEPGRAPPRAGAFRPRKIAPTKFRLFYERGDLPISIAHRPNGNKLDWKLDRKALDYHHYLPIFFDGLREVEEPYQFLAVQGCYDLLEVGESRILPTIPQLIIPIKEALNTRVPEVIATVLKVLQRLVLSADLVGEALVPYHRQILPVLALFKSSNKNTGDQIDYSQRKRSNLGDLIEETLQLLEIKGGEDAFINIKYMIPTYESCVLADN